MSEGNFEAKKHAYRQTQDGVVISFVIHPNDVDAALSVAPLGTRYMIGWAEITDAENTATIAAKPAEDKPKRERTLAEQCADVCRDQRFLAFLKKTYPFALPQDVPAIVRRLLGVQSRSELGKDNHDADSRWHTLHQEYRNYLADLEYGTGTR